MSKIHYVILLSAVLAGCSGDRTNTTPDTHNRTQPIKSEAELAVHQVPLPQVPDSLKQPSQRLDYMMLHFWDAMDFNDPAMVTDTLMVEQTFSNFIELLPRTSSEAALSKAVSRMYEQAAVNPSAYAELVSLADKYLADDESPFKNAALYRYFDDAVKKPTK